MANKKIKPVSETIPEQETAAETVVDKLAAEAPVLGSAHAFNDKVKTELARLETVENENLRLNRENQELKTRIAEYIDEIDQLKKNGNSSEVKQLTDENDKYLMKISELTFENAKLEAKLQEQTAKQTKSGRCANPNTVAYRNVYRNSAAINGYTSWN